MLSVPSARFLTTPNFSAKLPSQASPRRRFTPPLAFAATSTESRSATSYMASASTSLYETLGIHKGATCQEIKRAYRRLARTCHPDVVAAPDRKDLSAGEFMRIHAAYSTLSDPEKRADYDHKLFRPYRPLTKTSGFSGYTRRNWETDQCW